ncbi:MAG: O-antigen ligase domain-containing protein [Planctomycetaceae bacterium]
MTVAVPLTLFGWVPFVLLLFLTLPPRRAVLVAFLGAWLFLPDAGYQLPGLPDYTKMFATCVGVLLGMLFFDFQRLMSFRPRWFDIPMFVLCTSVFISSMTNNLGSYDGLTWVVEQTITWGVPYFIGRVYFTDAESIRELAIGMFLSALIYVPICLFEVKMSPQLTRWVYGIDTGWAGSRLGGWRPQGFMNSGLMLAMWMTSGSLCGIWLWKSGAMNQIWKIKPIWAVPLVIITTILCRSSGAILLMFGGTALLFICRWLRSPIPLLIVVLIPLAYSWARATNMWDGQEAVTLAGEILEPQRAQSLDFRFDNENQLAAKALKQKWFGWGRWGRSRIRDEFDKDISTVDGLWILSFGQSGLVGLAAVTLIYVLPVILLCWRHPVSEWSTPHLAAVTVLSLILALYSIDNLLNAKINPICALAMGALNGLTRVSATELALATTGMMAGGIKPQRFQRKLWPPPVNGSEPISPPPPGTQRGQQVQPKRLPG